jgi:hypothetical protein
MELGRLGIWILSLAPFKFKVTHISGKSNVVADYLTRQFEDLPSDQVFWAGVTVLAGCVSIDS